jgi:hypothetical protein
MLSEGASTEFELFTYWLEQACAATFPDNQKRNVMAALLTDELLQALNVLLDNHVLHRQKAAKRGGCYKSKIWYPISCEGWCKGWCCCEGWCKVQGCCCCGGCCKSAAALLRAPSSERAAARTTRQECCCCCCCSHGCCCKNAAARALPRPRSMARCRHELRASI